MITLCLCMWFLFIPGYLENKIEEKLPVLFETPMLDQVTETSVTIHVNNFEYGAGEAKPDQYLIQYKEKNENDFKNHSSPFPYSPDQENKTFTIDVNVTERCECKIRILLLVKGQYSTTATPEIIIGSLTQIDITSSKISLKWSDSPHVNYTIEHQCLQEYCNTHSYGTDEKYKSVYSLTSLDPFTKCSINLYHQNGSKPVHAINATTHKIDNIIFPTNITFTNNNSMNMNFEDCNHFTKSLKYAFDLRCVSEWCENKIFNVIDPIEKDKYNKTETITVGELLPFTKYELRVNATLWNASNSTKYSLRTPPARPKQVEDLSFEYQNKTTLWIKWQLPYPPTGNISGYTIKSDTTTKTIRNNETFQCGPKPNYTCIEIKRERICNITVQVMNKDVKELGPPSCITLSSAFENFCQDKSSTLKSGYITTKICFIIIILILIIVTIGIYGLVRRNYISISKFLPDIDILQPWQYFTMNAMDRSPTPPNNSQHETLIQPKMRQHCYTSSINNDSRTLTSTSIKVEAYENYLMTCFCSIPYSALSSQFKILPGPTRPVIYARHDSNRKKNKDNQNVPYDDSRVILREMEGMGTGTYINASYINGLDRPKAYIATQGPKFFTDKDFWRMIWQENVETIVMATNFIENKKRKCAEYFPQKLNTIFECGKMLIKLASEQFYEYYVHRTFEIYYDDYCRRVQHLQLKWNPDNMTPLYPDHIVPLIKRISNIRDESNTPIVIHCSSGVNRTGTLILCDLALHMAKTENRVDFYSLTLEMRNQRPNIVSSEKQYFLAHLIVLECLMEEENVFKKSLKENLDSSLLNSQLKFLERLCDYDKVVKSWSDGLDKCSVHHTLADGYTKPQKYLATKSPNKDSIHDFWDTIVKKNIKTILLLDTTIQNTIWPYHQQNPATRVTVVEMDSNSNNHYSLTILFLRINQLPLNRIIFENTISVFQMKSKNTSGLLQLVNDILKECENTTPILVACSDGITTTGKYIALSYIIEKYLNESEVDVCNAVRCIRRCGTKFIKTKEQLKFLYNASLEYVEKYESYSGAL